LASRSTFNAIPTANPAAVVDPMTAAAFLIDLKFLYLKFFSRIIKPLPRMFYKYLKSKARFH